ncbi:Various polyols ABC transporter, ATP-binding component (plasmid) [Sinorhizobium fredii CCBAU 83666]|nr:Various polyols ABC transporter, ATP-binding component [Sinorhizobium fredii CCBAU 83666]
MATSVVLQKVEKRYGALDVIHGIDLTIDPGEFAVFVGPSGCGKSTLLRMIAGLEEITGGTLMLDNDRMNEVAPARRGIAMVFQSYALYPHMSVYKNLAFGLETAGYKKADIEPKVRRAAEILQIEKLLDRKPKALSGGQRQRVAIGRAIVREPRIFLFDEPLSNLDAELRVQMRVEISRLHRDLGNTMIYVTHDQVEAMTMADKIVVLNSGRIEQVGAPLDLYNNPVSWDRRRHGKRNRHRSLRRHDPPAAPPQRGNAGSGSYLRHSPRTPLGPRQRHRARRRQCRARGESRRRDHALRHHARQPAADHSPRRPAEGGARRQSLRLLRPYPLSRLRLGRQGDVGGNSSEASFGANCHSGRDRHRGGDAATAPRVLSDARWLL